MTGWLTSLEPLAGVWVQSVLRASFQGGAAILLAAVVTVPFRRLHPNVRCWIWRLTLIKLLFALTSISPIAVPVLHASASPPRTWTEGSGIEPRKVDATLHRKAVRPSRVVPWRPLGSLARDLARPMHLLPPVADPATPDREVTATRWAAILFVSWCLGVVGGLVRMLRAWMLASDLGREIVPIDDGPLAVCYAELVRSNGVSGPPRLLLSDAVSSPLLLATGAPAILLPISLVRSCSVRELELILAHELAHWKRCDLRWGWLDAAVSLLFFFHPLVWVARRELRLAGEMAADAVAVEMVGVGVADYAGMLIRVAAGPLARVAAVPPIGTVHVAQESVRTLRRRLRMLSTLAGHVAVSAGATSRWRRSFAASSLVGLALLALTPWRLTAASAASAARPGTDAMASVSAPLLTDSAVIPDPATGIPAPEAPLPGGGPVEEMRGAEPASGTQARAAERWEDVLLLEAQRYLDLTPNQLHEMLPLARHAAGRLRKLEEEERRTLASIDRIAELNRQALLNGRPGARQDQALLLDRTMRRRRAQTEEELTRFVTERLGRILTTEQIARAFLLAIGEPIRDRNRVTSPALLDPNAGFVGNAEPAEPTPGQRVAQQLREQWTTRRSGLVSRSILARVQELKGVPLRQNSSVITLDQLGNKYSISLNFTQAGDAPADLAANSAAVEAARRAEAELNAHPELTALRVVEEAKPEERAGMLELLARRMFLSPRLVPVLEERLAG